MSLLAELFERLETPIAGVDTLKTERIGSTAPTPRFHPSQNMAAMTSSVLVLVDPRPDPAPSPALQDERPDGKPQHIVHTAATASPEWIAARNQYVSHQMACRACYAPTGRYCVTGTELRQQYCQTPMVQHS